MGELPALEDVKAGRLLLYKGQEWLVAERDSSGGVGYSELQWTLHGKGEDRGTYYLLRTRELGGPEAWVLTRQARLSSFFYERRPGDWNCLKELSMPAEPPQALKYGDSYFNFEGESSCDAVDDEGDTVKKVTWDYYSADRRRNLAVEIWKEPDRDYPEAYDGLVVTPAEFRVLDKTAAVKQRRAGSGGGAGEGDPVQLGLGLAGIMVLVLGTSGVPLEYVFAGAVPAAALGTLALQGFPGWVKAVSAAIWAAVAALAWFTGASLNFWQVAAFCAALSFLLPKLAGAAMAADGLEETWRVAAFGAFPALWVYSFTRYLLFAPGPRSFAQFLAACLLPAAAGAACYFAARAAGRSGV